MKTKNTNSNSNLLSRRDAAGKISFLAIACILVPKISLSATSKVVKPTQNKLLSFRAGIQGGNNVRLVCETTKKAEFKYSFMTNPDRLIIDIANTNLRPGIIVPKKTLFLKSIRYSPFNGGVRIVVDLDKTAEVHKNFTIQGSGKNNHRLVFDLKESKTQAKRIPADPSVNAVPSGLDMNSPDANPTNGNNNNKKKKRTRDFTVVIDPGHGGKDPGCIGHGGTREKDIVLQIGKNLRNQLLIDGRFNVIMTRSSDVYIALRERARTSDKNNADLFVSIHADSSPTDVDGLSVYTLSDQASDVEAARLAEKENASDLLGLGKSFDAYDPATKNILGDLAQLEVKEVSMKFADTIVQNSRRNPKISVLKSHPHREAGFAVLKSSVPSVLVESGFLSNRREEKLLKQVEYRSEIARSIKDAIKVHLNLA